MVERILDVYRLSKCWKRANVYCIVELSEDFMSPSLKPNYYPEDPGPLFKQTCVIDISRGRCAVTSPYGCRQ
jgi:hypothetical protein